MNVLNAVPLRATASRRAIAFSLIMVMFWFPVLLWFGVARAIGGRGSTRAAHYINSGV